MIEEMSWREREDLGESHYETCEPTYYGFDGYWNDREYLEEQEWNIIQGVAEAEGVSWEEAHKIVCGETEYRDTADMFNPTYDTEWQEV